MPRGRRYTGWAAKSAVLPRRKGHAGSATGRQPLSGTGEGGPAGTFHPPDDSPSAAPGGRTQSPAQHPTSRTTQQRGPMLYPPAQPPAVRPDQHFHQPRVRTLVTVNLILGALPSPPRGRFQKQDGHSRQRGGENSHLMQGSGAFNLPDASVGWHPSGRVPLQIREPEPSPPRANTRSCVRNSHPLPGGAASARA